VRASAARCSRSRKAEIASRYPSRDAYLGRFALDALRLVDERYVVREDLPDLLRRGAELWDWIVGTPARAPGAASPSVE
jgi:hypothetical protein